MAQARVNSGSRSAPRDHAVNIAIESHASQSGSLFGIERHRSSAVLFIGLGFFSERTLAGGDTIWCVTASEAKALTLASGLPMANRIRSADQASATEFTIVGSEMEASTWESYLSGLDEIVDSYRSDDIDSPTSLAGFERELQALRVGCGSTMTFPALGWKPTGSQATQGGSRSRSTSQPPAGGGRGGRRPRTSRSQPAVSETAVDSEGSAGEEEEARTAANHPLPPALAFLYHLDCGSFHPASESDKGESGLLQLARLVLALGETDSPSELANPRGQAQQAIHLLAPYFCKYVHMEANREPDQAMLSAQYGSFLAACVLEWELTPNGTDDARSVSLKELLLGAQHKLGSNDEVNRIEADCLLNIIHKPSSELPTIATLLSTAAPSGKAVSVCERLVAAFLPHRSSLRLRHCLPQLEAKLAPSAALISNGYEGSEGEQPMGLMEVVRALEVRAEETAADLKGAGNPAQLGNSTAGPLSPQLRSETRMACLAEPAFIVESDKAGALALPQQLDELWEGAFRRAGNLANTFACSIPDGLVSLCNYFALLKQWSFHRQAYTARAQTARFRGIVPDSALNEWKYCHKALHACLDQGRITHTAFIEGPGGFMALLALVESNPIAAIPPDQYLTVVAVVEEFSKHMHATLVCWGFDDVSEVGWTAKTFWESHIANLKWFRALGAEGHHQVDWCAQEAVEVQLMISSQWLAARTSSRQLEAKSGIYLPFGNTYDVRVAARKQSCSGLVHWRAVVPHLLQPQEPRVLEGVKTDGRGRSTSNPVLPRPNPYGGGGSKVTARTSSSGGVAHAGGGAAHVDAPGTKAHLISYIDGADGSKSTGLFIGNEGPFDTKGIRAHYGLSELCPSLLSSKVGAGKLAICPCFGQPGHDGPSSSAHVAPHGWDMGLIRQRFLRATSTSGPASTRNARSGRSPHRSRPPSNTGPQRPQGGGAGSNSVGSPRGANAPSAGRPRTQRSGGAPRRSPRNNTNASSNTNPPSANNAGQTSSGNKRRVGAI